MPELPKSYQLAHDIDWFFKTDERLYHCASNCSVIPQKFADNSNLRSAQEIVATLPDIVADEEVMINEEYEQLYVSPQIERLGEIFGDYPPMSPQELRDVHLSSFMSMARKGLWSFDHAIDMDGNAYILVAYPVVDVDINQLLEIGHPMQPGVLLGDTIPSFHPIDKLVNHRLTIRI